MQHVLLANSQRLALCSRWYNRSSSLQQHNIQKARLHLHRCCLASFGGCSMDFRQSSFQLHRLHSSPTLQYTTNYGVSKIKHIRNSYNSNGFLILHRSLSSAASPDESKEKGKIQTAQSGQQLTPAPPKPSLPARIWHEIVHYWNGMRLLILEIKIATRIGLKYLRGKTITRRERRHFVRTVADLFRMVPFIFFIVVPFMELLLPLYLKFMPFMLPSTFQQKDKEAEKLRLRLKAKLETAKFLQATLQEGFQSKNATAEVRQSLDDFRNFVEKCSTAGRYATTDELLRFSRLFADELTLDNLERPQLAAICKLLDVPAVGSKALIELQLEIRLRQLHADDRMIQAEGLDKLNVAELQAACRARGMRSLGLSEERLRQQLTQWLDLHLNSKVPTSLLLLSRSLHFPDSLEPEDLLRKTIAALPKRTVASVEAKSAGADNRVRLEALKSADADVAKEAAEVAEAEAEASRAAAAAAAAAPASLEAGSLQQQLEKLQQMPEQITVDGGVSEIEKLRGVVGTGELRQLESAISQVAGERLLQDQAIRDLKESKAASAAPMLDEAPTSKVEAMLSGKLNRLVGEIDDMMTKVQLERQHLERRIREQMEKDTSGQLTEQLLSLNDLQLALKRFQRNPDDNQWEKILPLLDEDNDGKIEIHHVTKVIEMLGSDNSRLNSGDLAKLLEALDKERLMLAKDAKTQADSAKNAQIAADSGDKTKA